MDDLNFMKMRFVGQTVFWKKGADDRQITVKIMDINSVGIVFKVIKIGTYDKEGYSFHGYVVGEVQFESWGCKPYFSEIRNVYE